MLKKISIFMTLTFIVSVAFGQTISDIKNAYQQEDYNKCIQLADSFINKNPNSPDIPTALYLKGGAEMKIENFNNAIESFTKIINKYPNFSKIDQILYFRAYSYYKAGFETEAKNDINNLKTKYPNSQYIPKADALLAEMNSIGTEEDLDIGSTSSYSTKKAEKYSWTKITWTKIAAGTTLIASPIFLIMANSAQKDADSLYDNKYMKATSESEAILYWNQVTDKDKEAANLKTFSLISFMAGIGFFALDYFVFGKVPAKSVSYSTTEKINLFSFNLEKNSCKLKYSIRF
jgi:tetratricopeptide (TPR) repeat protein